MYGILLMLHVFIAIVLVTLILIQHGKGAQTGASFGSGASQTVFGSAGSGGFLSNTTAILAAIFFLLSLGLAVMSSRSAHRDNMHSPVVQEEAPSKKMTPAEKKKGEGAISETDVPEVE